VNCVRFNCRVVFGIVSTYEHNTVEYLLLVTVCTVIYVYLYRCFLHQWDTEDLTGLLNYGRRWTY